MKLSEMDTEYDCGHGSTNDFSNMPPEKQKWWKEYSAQCDAWNAEQDRKEAAKKKGTVNQ